MASVDALRLRALASKEAGALIACIGDEDTVTGFMLAGIGDIDMKRKSNFMVVTSKTTTTKIATKFVELTEREDVAILLITQNVANMIRSHIDGYEQLFPTILEIPSKDHPYDAEQDTVMLKVARMLGAASPNDIVLGEAES